VSLLAQTIEAIKDAMRLADDVRRASDTLKDLTEQIRDQDRRITRLEAQWETAALLSRRRLIGRDSRLPLFLRVNARAQNRVHALRGP